MTASELKQKLYWNGLKLKAAIEAKNAEQIEQFCREGVELRELQERMEAEQHANAG